MQKTPDPSEFFTTNGMKKGLSNAVDSKKPFTAIGTVQYGNGNHAFNIIGYDSETGMVTGFDTSRNSHDVESIYINDLTSVRTLTYEGE